MSASKPTPPGSDPIYKRLYAFPEMVADLLRSLLPAADFDIDAASLEKLPAEYVADNYRQRRGDTVWRLRAKGGDLHVMVLLEFQSTTNAHMALRVLEYTAMLYRELVRQGDLAPDGLLPPVLPIVLYNGAATWHSASQMRELVAPTGPALAQFQPSQCHVVLDERRAQADDSQLGDLTRAMVLLEQSRSAADLDRAAAFLEGPLGARGDELREAFADWLTILLWRLERGAGPAADEGPPRKLSFKEVRMTLADRVAEWPKPYIRQGREEGIILGREEGISLGREEGISLGREEGISLGREEGISLGREQGISRGREQGREEGIAQLRLMLRRMAAVRFGAATADRLARALAAEADPARLSRIGEVVVRCATADELLRAAGVSI